MANEVKIEISVLDKASEAIKKFTGTFKGSFTELNSMIGVGEKAFHALKGTIDEVIGSTMDYAKDVRDLSRAIGSSSNEASKLIQIADDVEIGVDTLKMAFKTAIKQGITPNIAGLKAVAKEYQALPTPLEKSQFAIEKFGRAGLEMNKILELTPEQIDVMARSAEAAGLVMDEAMIAKTEEYRLAMDEMNDSIMGLKITLGTALIPTLTESITGLTSNSQAIILMKKAYDDGDIGLIQFLKTFATTDEYAIANAEAIDELTKKTRIQEAAEQSWLTIEEAMTGGMRNARTAADELTGAEGELEAATSKLSEASKKYSAELIFNKAAMNLDEDAAIKLGVEMGVLDSRTLLANAVMVNLKKQLDANTISTTEYAAITIRLQQAISNLKDKDVTVTVHYKTTGKDTEGRYKQDQTGGPVAAGQVYLVGERGPELFRPGAGGQIIPNNQINIYGGVNMNMRAGTGKAAFDEFMAELARQTRGASNARAQSIGA